jgi:hypothetical protein
MIILFSTALIVGIFVIVDAKSEKYFVGSVINLGH